MNREATRHIEVVGWGFIIPLTIMGIGGAMGHIFDGFFATGDIDAIAEVNIALFGEDFFNHWLNFRTYPWARMLHMIPGLIVMLLMPLQFVKSIRVNHPRVHRFCGYVVICGTLFLVPTGLIFAFQHPYVGFKEQVPTVFYASIYVCCVTMALRKVYVRNFAAHREWMIRIFAMGIGIYSIRVWYSLFMHLTDVPSQEFFATSFWIGIAFNLIVGEVWINITRQTAAAK